MPQNEFKTRMDARLTQWYKNGDPNPDPALQKRRKFVAGLVNKSAMFKYATRMDLPLPERFAEATSLDELDFDALPERVVIKPNNSADNDCVMLFNGEEEVFTGDTVPLAERPDYVRDTFAQGRFIKPNTKIIAEEFIQDYDDRFVVPRDFKVFVAGGRPWVIQVVDRTGPKKNWRHRYYSQDWVAYGHFNMTNELDDIIEEPMHFQQMMDLSRRIAEDIGCFMRLDFYLAKRGAVFGEFTSYPNAGLQFTRTGTNVLCDLMDRYPDPF